MVPTDRTVLTQILHIVGFDACHPIGIIRGRMKEETLCQTLHYFRIHLLSSFPDGVHSPSGAVNSP